jgi:hypothetical protein
MMSKKIYSASMLFCILLLNSLCWLNKEARMRKIGFLLVVLSMALVIASCASSPQVNTSEIPSFWLNPPTSKDTLYGVGSAKMSSLDLSRTTATASARDEVAQEVQVTVKNALTKYAQQAGEGDNQQTLAYVETVSRQVANVTLSGCRTEKVSVASDGTVYALVSYPVTNMMDTAKTQFSRNDASAFAEFKANEALKRLNDEIQNNPPKATGEQGSKP